MLPGSRSPNDYMFGPDPDKEARDRHTNDTAVYNLRAWIAKQDMAVKRRNAELKLMAALFFIALLALCAGSWVIIAGEGSPVSPELSAAAFGFSLVIALASATALIVLGRKHLR